MSAVEIVALAIWIMLPAYLPNNVAVLVGGGAPIDGGRTLGGARVLGDGKTWRGLVGGVTAGMVVAIGLNVAEPTVSAALNVELAQFPMLAVAALPLGALFGDIGASFVKRRFGAERGASVPGLDQYDLVIGSLGLTAIVAWGWLSATLTWWVLAAILVLTPMLHLATNAIAYLVGIKEVPW